MTINCDCGEKQWLEFIEGRLTCTNCGAEDTGDLNFESNENKEVGNK